jgi:hypothetical protein
MSLRNKLECTAQQQASILAAIHFVGAALRICGLDSDDIVTLLCNPASSRRRPLHYGGEAAGWRSDQAALDRLVPSAAEEPACASAPFVFQFGAEGHRCRIWSRSSAEIFRPGSRFRSL